MFADAEDMPAAYRYLRVRLRIEQTRLLRWGEKVGLAEEILDEPSLVLQLNRNLIFDILLEIQNLFKSTLKIQVKFDRLVPERPLPAAGTQSETEDRFLKKTLNVLNKIPQAPQRLHWAMIKQDEFKGLIEKLIGYNDAIEALLEARAVDQLLYMQRQTYMSILQLHSKVIDLRDISQAMRVQTQSPSRGVVGGLDGARITTEHQKDNKDLADLASFKAQQTSIEHEPNLEEPIPATEIIFRSRDEDEVRCEATFHNQSVWIEWKQYDSENENPQWNSIITQRVKNLVTLLKSANRPLHFLGPTCLGYFLDQSYETQRYGYIYQNPYTAFSAPPTSLHSQIVTQKSRPSLTQRVALAYKLAHSLMYLHSVNWLHKGLRSSNVLFFLPPSDSKPSYSSPLISGFEFARLDLVDELTEPVPQHSSNDLYRHPGVLRTIHPRSKKSHDIYSLGIVLIEIARWETVGDILKLPEDERAARKIVKKAKELLLGSDHMDVLEGLVGDGYAHAVRRCMEGVVASDADEENPAVGVEIQRVFSEEVVSRLGSMTI